MKKKLLYSFCFCLLFVPSCNQDNEFQDLTSTSRSTNVTDQTIQKAWVNAGYFRWTDDTKTALELTELGKQQAYLPDVSDGEQLTSASSMFASSPNLKKAPYFNTSNITKFWTMFIDCTSLVTIPKYDTSKGKNFIGMFYNCTSLLAVPDLDTSRGETFFTMFANCKSLMHKPVLDLSNTNPDIPYTTYKIFAGTPFDDGK